MLEYVGVSKAFGSVQALSNVSLALQRGDVLGLLGPNGAGKTTLIRMLAGLTSPDAGTIRVLGADVPNMLPSVATRIGFSFAEPALLGGLSALENVRIAAALAQSSADAEPALEQLGLEPDDPRPVRTYSTGMRLRVGIATAVVHGPDVLVLDEPTAGLDPEGRDIVRAVIRRVSSRGGAVLVSSHELGEVQATCGRVALLAKGRLAVEGPLDDLLHSDETAVEVPDCGEVLASLERSRIAVRQEGNALVVADGDVERLLRSLARRGIYPRAVRPQRRTVEELWRQATGPEA